jgi:acetylornithine deacetylase/succinyl-diaminopimelate desuccinylase-like protein
MKKLKKLLYGSICALFCLTVIVGVNTAVTKSKQVTVENKDLNIKLNMDKASKNLSNALKYKTVSYTDLTKFDYNEFIKLHQFIDNTYPNVKSKLKKEVINNYSLLYTWQGKNKDLKPLVLTAHMNVVGVEDSTLKEWKHEPFSGDTVEKVKEKVIQTIDDKNVKVELYGYCKNAPESSPTNTEAFTKVQQSLKEVFPNAISVPYFSSGGTDSKYYTKITKNRYQMTPSLKEKDEEAHGINERISVDNYEQYIKAFVELIKNFN